MVSGESKPPRGLRNCRRPVRREESQTSGRRPQVVLLLALVWRLRRDAALQHGRYFLIPISRNEAARRHGAENLQNVARCSNATDVFAYP
jgi:hypothetical protein